MRRLDPTDGKAADKIVPPRLRIPYWKGLGADSEEKHEPAGDIDTVVVDSLKALDPKRPIREADIVGRPRPNLPVVHLLVLVGMKAASFKGLDTPVADVARPQSNWTIRRFQRGHAPRARQLIEAVWHEHFDRHPDPFVRNFIYSRLSDIDDAETAYGDQAIFLCAVTETEIVGTGAIKRI